MSVTALLRPGLPMAWGRVWQPARLPLALSHLWVDGGDDDADIAMALESSLANAASTADTETCWPEESVNTQT